MGKLMARAASQIPAPVGYRMMVLLTMAPMTLLTVLTMTLIRTAFQTAQSGGSYGSMVSGSILIALLICTCKVVSPRRCSKVWIPGTQRCVFR